MKIVNPANGQVITSIAAMDKSAIGSVYQKAREAQIAWANVPLAERVAVIQRYNAWLEKHREGIAHVLSKEVGKPLQQARNEVNGARGRISWLVDHAVQYLSDEVMTTGPVEERISYEPLGVIANISAWNYPMLVGTNVFIPALLAGNAVLYKPSEFATMTGMEMAKGLHASGVPEQVFQVVAGGRETGEALLDLPLDGYFFTGSWRTGQYIYERVAPKMVPCQCELGGKDPLYVTDEIDDVALVAAGTADGAFYNNGQSCCAVERIYVHEKVYDAYVAAFVKEVRGYKVGLPEEEGVYIGPLTREAQLEVLQDQVDDAIGKGARVEVGGKRMDRAGYYFEPTVLTGVKHDMKVMRDESFGPIIGIMKVRDDAEAIRLMNDTEYGLTAAVYCKSEARAVSILGKLDVGTGYWNCCDRVSPAVPWAGRKHSGFGATLSHQGLRAFAKTKSWQLRKP